MTIQYNQTQALNFNYISELWAAQNAKHGIKKSKDKRETVGVQNVRFVEQTQSVLGGALTTNGLTSECDFSTYPDKAIIKFKNNLGYNCYLRLLMIVGNRIIRSSGEMGSILLDDLKHDDDIRRNGEHKKKISNDYIFDVTQVATLADYWYKKSGEKKHMYKITIKGFCPWYEPGERYTLTLGGAGKNEYIDSTVEVYKVETGRDAGGIGTTSLVLRECMESWSKTTYYTARYITGASPKRRNNQSNSVIVGNNTYSGTYDYRCDGTDDDVQIQLAIDELDEMGGGRINLPGGKYYISADTFLKSNIIISGEGPYTELILSGTADIKYTGADSAIENVYIYGTGGSTHQVQCYSGTGGSSGALTGCLIGDDITVFLGVNSMIAGSRFIGTSWCVLNGTSTATRNTFENSTGSSQCLAWSSTIGNIISNNIFMMPATTEYACAIYAASAKTIIAHNIIYGRAWNDSQEKLGIIVTAINCIVSGNSVFDLVNTGSGNGYGIGITAGSDKANVCGNTALGCDSNYTNSGTGTVATGNVFS